MSYTRTQERPDTSPWMTVVEAAAHARMSPEDVAEACRLGELRATQRKARGRWRIHVDNLDAWLLGEPQGHEAPRLARGRAS